MCLVPVDLTPQELRAAADALHAMFTPSEEGRVMDDRDEGLRELGILICVLAICGAVAGIVTAILWWVQ